MFDKAEKSLLEQVNEHVQLTLEVKAQREAIILAARLIVGSLRNGGTVLWCGNGGSAADAQHLAAELVGRYRREREAFSSVALTTDTSALTAIGNDYGFAHIFERQVAALCSKEDILVALSTSGRSPNVLLAVQKAKEIGAKVIVFAGSEKTVMTSQADVVFRLDSQATARVQEMHILIGHLLCDLVEAELCESNV